MADNNGDQGRADSMKVDTALVRELAEMLNETGLTEIEVEDGGRKIRVSRGGTISHTATMAAPSVAAAPVAEGGAALASSEPPPGPDHSNAIRSPMVGTAYLSAEPGAEPLIRKGTQVKTGDTLLIVEAMKVMNPITATSDGTVIDILIENAQPVEFDQPLVVLG